jgi:hypothetical protein
MHLHLHRVPSSHLADGAGLALFASALVLLIAAAALMSAAIPWR